MAAVGMNKMPTKRAAFGDVSNTAHANRPVKDDSILLGKPSTYDTKEHAVSQLKGETKASAALLRPAQRPLASSNTFKNTTANNVVAAAGVAPSLKPNSEVAVQPASTANIRKTLAKRSTTVFKDYSTVTQPTQGAIDLSKPLPPVHQEIDTHLQPVTSRAPEIKPVQRQIRKVQSTYSVVPSRSESIKPEDLKALVHVPAVRSSTKNEIYGPRQAQLPHSQSAVQDYRCESDAQLASLMARVETSVSTQDIGYVPPSEYEYSCEVVAKPYPTTISSKEPLATVGEPEEYWEDEDDDDNYDEEGYVTARSFKSRGENLTGNATTVLVPRTTHRARKEIEAARILVETMKTPDEGEDEMWDTTMVAEYGEEIFEYMHELEVSPHKHAWIFTTDSQQDSFAAQSSLHGCSNRDPMVDALCLDGLARTGAPSFPAPPGDPLSLCELHR